MRNFFKNSLKALSLGTLMFATCKQIMAQYGVPTDYYLKQIISVVTESKEPIKGLEVTVYNDNDTSILYTNESGIVQFPLDLIESKLKIKDIDGKENLGKFTELNAIILRRKKSFIMKEEKDKQND